MEIHRWLAGARATLDRAGVESARLDTLVLLEDTIDKDRAWVLAHPEHELDERLCELLDERLVRRARREPLAYIRGKIEFYGREFMVSPHVLIPRPESEAMIDLLKKFLPTADYQLPTILDVGTGSGCLAIIAKLEFPDVQVIATDISREALAVAQQNARALGVKVAFRQSDLLSAIDCQPSTIVLANLPYVPDNLVTSPEITREPSMALFSGRDGLNHYRALFSQIYRQSTPPLCIMTESLETQHQSLTDIAAKYGLELHETKDLIQVFRPEAA